MITHDPATLGEHWAQGVCRCLCAMPSTLHFPRVKGMLACFPCPALLLSFARCAQGQGPGLRCLPTALCCAVTIGGCPPEEQARSYAMRQVGRAPCTGHAFRWLRGRVMLWVALLLLRPIHAVLVKCIQDLTWIARKGP